MFTRSSKSIESGLSKYFYLLSIGGTVLVLATVWVYLPAQFTVFGLYGLFGLFCGGAFYRYSNRGTSVQRFFINERLHRLGVYITCAVTVGTVALTGEKLGVLFGLGVGYALVIRQLFAQPRPARLLPQMTALFLLSPITKYLTAGRYIGDGDLLIHTRLIENILRDETLVAISSGSYQAFPGLHLAAATLGSVSGLGPYDGLLLLGVGAYTVLIPAIYLITARFTDNELLALSTAFGTTVLSDLSFFVSYIFPQALATILLVVLVLLMRMASRDEIFWPVTAVFGLITTALAFTHHLTQVLFVPVVCCIVLFYAVRGRRYASAFFQRRYVALFGLFALVNGIHLMRTGFFERLNRAATGIVQGGPFGGYTRSVSLVFGDVQQSDSVLLAIEWLFSPYGLYLILLLALFSIGVAWSLQTPWDPAIKAVALTGMLGAILVFETPISIKSLARISSPWLFPFAFIIGISIYQLRRNVSSTGQRRLLIAGLVVLAATTPVVTGDNYYELDPRPTTETAFTEQEFSELQATATFLERQEVQTTVLWNTRLVMERFRIDNLEYGTVQDRTLQLPPGYFVHRTAWTDHRVSFMAESDQSLYSNGLDVSDGWLSHRVEAGNKVYTAGETEITWSSTERGFGDTAPPTTS